MQRLYLDLDGVVADFEGGFQKIFKKHHKSISDIEMWKHINEYGTFFQDIEPFKGALHFFDLLASNFDIMILTACPKSNYWDAAKQKKQWVKTHMSPNVMVLPVLGGKNKALFMNEPGDILIDDFEKNIKSWEKEGGIGILHKDFLDTCKKLDKIMEKKNDS